MAIKTNTFYKVKEVVNGRKLPGAFFYVLQYIWTPAGSKVKFVATETDKQTALVKSVRGGFILSEDDFLQMVEA